MRYKVKLFVVLVMIFLNSLMFTKPPALPNLGNSCYMNAMLQCLLNIPPLKKMFIYEKEPVHEFFKSYQNVLKHIDNSIFLKDFYKWIQVAIDFKETDKIKFVADLTKDEVSRQYKANEENEQCNLQQDTSDVLKKIFQFIDADYKDKEGNNKFVDSELRDGFKHILGVRVLDGIWCKGEIEKKPDLKWYMHLDIPNPYNGKGSLYDFLNQSNSLPSDYNVKDLPNGMKNEDCRIQIRYSSIPEFFIMALARFRVTDYKFDDKNNVIPIKEKISDPINMPFQLDMRDYMAPDFNKDDQLDCAYELISFTNTGGLGGGHYVAYIKDQSEKNPSWWHCSDSTITAASEKDVEKAAQKGYVYVYRRMSKQDAKIFFEGRDKEYQEAEKELGAKSVDSFAQALNSIAKG